MENVAGTCMVAAGAMQYWSGVARAASLQATSSQHPSKVFPDRRLHPDVAELLVMSRKFCGISFGSRTESSGVWRCAGYRAAVWWLLRSSDGRRSRRTRPDSRHCEVSPPLTLSPSRTADNPTETRLRLPQLPARPSLPCKLVGVKEFSGPWTEAQACWGKFYIFSLGSDGYSEWLLRASEGNQEIPSRVWKIWFSQPANLIRWSNKIRSAEVTEAKFCESENVFYKYFLKLHRVADEVARARIRWLRGNTN